MRRSHVTIDLGAIRHNAARARRPPRAHGALGGREGRRIRARRASTSRARRSTAARPRSASRRSARRSRSAASFPTSRIVVLGPTAAGGRPGRTRRLARADVHDERLPEGVPIHLKLDTGMGRWGLSELPVPGPLRRRPDDAPRHRRHRPALRPRAARAIPPGDRAVRRRLRAPRRQQRRGADCCPRRGSTPRAAASRSTASTRSARIRGRFGLRPALRWESRARAGRRLAPGESTGYGRLLRRRRGDLDRRSSPSATRTGSGAT